VARHVGISPSHLRSQFRKQYGMGVYGYIRHVKMLQAMRLLRTRTQRVSEIAERLGYSSVFVFSRAFKKEAGVAPRLYQKRHA
jgi:AraC-like DNA-binding protein